MSCEPGIESMQREHAAQNAKQRSEVQYLPLESLICTKSLEKGVRCAAGV